MPPRHYASSCYFRRADLCNNGESFEPAKNVRRRSPDRKALFLVEKMEIKWDLMFRAFEVAQSFCNFSS